MTDLDQLLSAPLAPVADAGFSARVMGRIRREEQKRLAVWSIFVAITATIACILLPMTILTDTVNHLVVSLATSLQVGIAVLVAALTWAYDKKLYRLLLEALN